ncbi:hypothetical protein [Actinosynnema sp. NPDC023587]|uniref:hypothetical protein n=1 Tax=Actinosynnema sp. NPDC023587 TaxID=3154695 RepID=UPI0033DA9714
MGDIADLLQAIGAVVTALTGAGMAAWGVVRTRRERPAAAQAGAERVAKALADAAADGELTAEEIAEALRHIQPNPPAEDGVDPA